MLKILKSKLLITFITATIVGGVSIKTLPIFYNTHTTMKKTQSSNVKNVTSNSKKSGKADSTKDLNSVSDSKNTSDNSQDDNTNNQKTINSKLEKSSNNSDANNQSTDSSYSKSTNNTNVGNKESTNIPSEVKIPTIHYDRTTSIYANDNVTLLRVEYYLNNKLIYYSVIENFDATTKSYTEKIYQCNRETNIDPLVRTDVYVNGNLIKSY